MRIEKFQPQAVYPVVLTSPAAALSPSGTDFKDLDVLDRPYCLGPTEADIGVYGFSRVAEGTLPVSKKYSYGIVLETKEIQNSEIHLSFSCSILTGSNEMQLSGHLGSGGTQNPSGGLDRLWSYGDLGSQSLLHHNTFLFDDDVGQKYTFLWVTITNYSSAAQDFRATFTSSFWSSAQNYPIIRDVNAA